MRVAQEVIEVLFGSVFWMRIENILLAEQHHQVLSEDFLRQRANALARRFGLAGII
ncbi:MAG: hypothetical protein HC808_11245 [Candidatus Competibacteraceae bacterium]|nr:hypothetical protein [Candidatus Competibacteraceae bacterium]